MSFSNLKKSDILGDIALNYLSDVVKNYRLDEYGDVKGMSKYQEVSKSARQKQLWAFRNHSLKLEAKELEKRKKEVQNDPFCSVNSYKKLFKPKPIILDEINTKINTKTPEEKMQISAATDEITLERTLKPYENEYYELDIPKELIPSKKYQDILTLDGKNYNLKALSDKEAEDLQELWKAQQPLH